METRKGLGAISFSRQHSPNRNFLCLWPVWWPVMAPLIQRYLGSHISGFCCLHGPGTGCGGWGGQAPKCGKRTWFIYVKEAYSAPRVETHRINPLLISSLNCGFGEESFKPSLLRKQIYSTTHFMEGHHAEVALESMYEYAWGSLWEKKTGTGPCGTLFQMFCRCSVEVEGARRFLPKSFWEAGLLSGSMSAHPLSFQQV